MTRPVVVEAIADAAAAALERQAPAAEQLELLPPTQHKPGDDRHQALIESVRRNRAGRPDGAQNIATRDAIDFVRRVFGDPMIESARWAMHTPDSLARELGCSKLEAFDRLEDLRKDLRRYMYAPRAAEDGAGNVPPPALVILNGDGRGAMTVDGRPLAPWEQAAAEMKVIQPLTPPSADKSQTDQSQEVG